MTERLDRMLQLRAQFPQAKLRECALALDLADDRALNAAKVVQAMLSLRIVDRAGGPHGCGSGCPVHGDPEFYPRRPIDWDRAVREILPPTTHAGALEWRGKLIRDLADRHALLKLWEAEDA